MNLYELLRIVVERGPYSEIEKADMTAVIKEAEDMNTLGGLAKTDITGHEHRYDHFTGRCIYCPRRLR